MSERKKKKKKTFGNCVYMHSAVCRSDIGDLHDCEKICEHNGERVVLRLASDYRIAPMAVLKEALP